MARNSAGFSLQSIDPNLLIAASRIDGLTAVQARGASATVGTSYEDVWDPAVSLTVLPSATILEVASSSTDDDISGTGARTIKIVGYDANYAKLEETLDLDGQVLVNTVGVYLGINSVRVTVCGTGLVNAGDIYLADDNGSWTNGVPQTANKIQAKILADAGKTQSSIFTVYAGHTGLITNLYVNAAPGKTITYRLIADDLDNGSKVVEIQGKVPAEGGFNLPVLAAPLAIAEKTTIRLQALVSATTAAVSGGYDLILLDNTKL